MTVTFMTFSFTFTIMIQFATLTPGFSNMGLTPGLVKLELRVKLGVSLTGFLKRVFLRALLGLGLSEAPKQRCRIAPFLSTRLVRVARRWVGVGGVGCVGGGAVGGGGRGGEGGGGGGGEVRSP